VLLATFIANGTNVRWSAMRGAIVAAVVYGALVPSMTRVPIDGDEPFYLLVTESIVRDFDLDLANQYRRLDLTASGRTDLQPQIGDPTGSGGEVYSRHPPFLPLLLVPGYLVGGLTGAVAMIALFGVLLVRSTIRLLEEEGIDEATIRAVFPFFAFGAPVLFYAARIWPEVPAAYFVVEALRGLRQQSPKRWIAALAALVFLKLRFVLVALGLLAVFFARREMFAALRRRRVAVLVLVLFAAPLLVLWAISGSVLNVHRWTELLPAHPFDYARGLFGLLLDGASGLAFQAPFYLLALLGMTRWREMPVAFRAGTLASLLYIVLLLPRDEWHGGWSPPLRYIVFLTPVLALGAAAVWRRVSAPVVAGIALWTAGVALHGISYPWRLFHIANGENRLGEWLSAAYQSDFSRLFPSFIRVNTAAWIAVAVLLAALVVARFHIPGQVTVSLAALVIAAGFSAGTRPADTIHFEDAHVTHDGGELFPKLYTSVRFAYRGGWLLFPDTSLTFLARQGIWTLHYVSGPGAVIELDGRVYHLPTGDQYQTLKVVIGRTGKTTLRCHSGQVNLERMDHEQR
ncbi:MAG: hypothetical protein WA208_07460, partial [Thermoanaerobaculia bacterium]